MTRYGGIAPKFFQNYVIGPAPLLLSNIIIQEVEIYLKPFPEPIKATAIAMMVSDGGNSRLLSR